MMLSRAARRARFIIALLLFACAFICANQLADDQNAAGSHNLMWAAASLIGTIQGALMLRADWLESSRRAVGKADRRRLGDPGVAPQLTIM